MASGIDQSGYQTVPLFNKRKAAVLTLCNFDCPIGLRIWPQQLTTESVQLQEGYAFSLLQGSSDSYSFSVVAGARRVERMICNAQHILPEETFLILEFHPETTEDDSSPVICYSPYLPTKEIISRLTPFLPRLIHDGFVGFGLANNRAGVEIFYSEEKYLTCFTSNHLRFTTFLAGHNLPPDPHLVLPSEVSHDHLSLLYHEKSVLPESLGKLSEKELDHINFCDDIQKEFDMYPVLDGPSFFLSSKEQDKIEARLEKHKDFADFVEDDFGTLLLEWSDFANECSEGFSGDLWEYCESLRLRDMIQFVMESVESALATKLKGIVDEADDIFRQCLTDRRKKLQPTYTHRPLPYFWYRGIVRKSGSCLRRDLIRSNWFFSDSGAL